MIPPPHVPILSMVVWAPAGGAILVALVGGRWVWGPRVLGIAFPLVSLGLAAMLWHGFSAKPGGEQSRELATWIAPVGASYDLSIDGLGSALILWVALLSLLALLSERARELDRKTIALVLLGETALLGMISSGDLLLFLSFYGLGLTSFTLLCHRKNAMQRFFLAQSAGLAATGLFAVESFHLADAQTGFPSADIARLSTLVVYPDFERTLFLWGALAFTLASGLVPFTFWLRESLEAMPGPGRVLLLGGFSLVPMEVLIRLVLPAFARGASGRDWLVIAIAVLSTLYAALAPRRGPSGGYWPVAIVGFQALVLVGLVSSSPDAVASAQLQGLHLALGMSALALAGATTASSASPQRQSSMLLVGGLATVVLLLPSRNRLPALAVILETEWSRSRTTALLLGCGILVMALRLLRELPTLASGSAADRRRKALLLLPVFVWWLVIALAPGEWTSRLGPPPWSSKASSGGEASEEEP